MPNRYPSLPRTAKEIRGASPGKVLAQEADSGHAGVFVLSDARFRPGGLRYPKCKISIQSHSYDSDILGYSGPSGRGSMLCSLEMSIVCK